MTQEHFPEPSPIEAHLHTLSGRLTSVPELYPIADMVTTNPAHATDVYNTYLVLAEELVSLDGSDLDTVRKAQDLIQGEVGSASTVGANNLSAELSERDIDLSSVASDSFDSTSPFYEPAIDEFVARLEGGHAMKVAGKNPSDHDPDSLKVIWGHTVITGEEALLHFVVMHYLERFISKALYDRGVPQAQQKDFFINAVTDVVILNGLKNPDNPIFNLWVAPKDKDGLGWITQDRLKSYTNQ